MSADAAVLRLTDAAAVTDLATYLTRARRVDPDGAVRLRAHGDVLASYVSPVHEGGLGGGTTVLGLRVSALAGPLELDATVPLAAMADRFARLETPGDAVVPVPPTRVVDAAWAGVEPPRSGWQRLGVVDPRLLAAVARAGIEEIAAGTPEGAGGHAVTRLRIGVWGREVEGVPGLPSGAAYALEALGFIGVEDVDVLAAGPWRRLTTSRGHVIARGRSLV